MRFLTFLLCCCFAPLLADEAMMLQAVDIIKNTFEVCYAPANWKHELTGWNLLNEIAKTKEKIEHKNLSLKEFHHVLKDFFNSTRDYHVRVMFYSTEEASLPFRVKGINGRYFITRIDGEDFPFEIGDELLEFNGKKTHEEVLRLRTKEFGFNNDQTDMMFAEMCLTSRRGALGHLVPKGEVKLLIQSKNTVTEHNLAWNYFYEKISEEPLKKGLISCPKHVFDDLKKSYICPEVFAIKRDLDESGRDIGFLPILGQKIWEDENSRFFHAYIFQSPNNKRIGYVRIPSFSGSVKESKEFQEIISCFQERSDALIIDQLDNPGGSLFFLYSICSMLTDTPLLTYKEKINITQKDVMDAVNELFFLEDIQTDEEAKEFYEDWLDGFEGDLEFANSFQDFNRYIIDQWEKGNTVTDPCYIVGIEYIRPNTNVRYTKPILVLTDALGISCGDWFPALLQDNKRAIILGSKTAGAGGAVKSVSFPNLLGIASYSYTATFPVRHDSKPIENLGVTPDISYDLTENDLRNDYEDYVRKILETVEAMILHE